MRRIKNTIHMNSGVIVSSLMLIVSQDRAFAGFCGGKDLNEPGFRNIPILHQDGVGSCYAQAAATLATYWNHQKRGFNKNFRFMASPEHMAWIDHFEVKKDNWAFGDERDDFEGGEAFDVLTSLKSSAGTCDKTEAARDIKNSLGGSVPGPDSEVIRVAILQTLLNNKGDVDRSWSEWKKKKSIEVEFKKDQFKCYFNLIQANASQLSGDLSSSLFRVSATKVLNDIFTNPSSECYDRTSFKAMPDPITVTAKNSGQMKAGLLMNALDEALNHSVPASVSFCAKMFSKKEFSAYGFVDNNEDSCGAHEVTITARKEFGSDGCYYLVRNSWGAFWEGNPENPPKACACRLVDGTYQDVCTAGILRVREYVGCWYKSDELQRNIYNVTSLR